MHRTAPGDDILFRPSKNVILFRRQFPFFQKGFAAADATAAGHGGGGGGGEGSQGQDNPVRRGAEGDHVHHEGGGGTQRIERRDAAALPPSESGVIY